MTAMASQSASLLSPLTTALGFEHGPQDLLRLFTLGLARWLPITTFSPVLGGRLAPSPVKLGLAVSLAAFLLPWLDTTAPARMPAGLEWWALVVKELLIGFLLGFGSSLLFWAADMGGRFLDAARGTTAANLMIPQLKVQSSLLGDFYFQLLLVLYLLLGGHRLLVDAVFRSYQLLPPFALQLRLESVADSFITGTAGALAIAVQLIAPALAALIVMDVMLAVTGRMAPQLNVFFLSLALKASVGALMAALSLYFIQDLSDGLMRDHHRWLARTAAALAGK